MFQASPKHVVAGSSKFYNHQLLDGSGGALKIEGIDMGCASLYFCLQTELARSRRRHLFPCHFPNFKVNLSSRLCSSASIAGPIENVS
jgi:hypothetical protein